ncbi:MAG: tetratricopeptide repeat protein [Acidobacteriota bacterium]
MFRPYRAGCGARQNFRRNLEAATLNPHDGDAQYQLGLIYQDRRGYTEAIARFQKAVEIDKTDPGPVYQLGCIAREQGRFQEALQYLNTAATLDPKHNSNEVWRELGATNFALGYVDLARQQLEAYVDRREYDPQGLYWLGRCYKSLNGQPMPVPPSHAPSKRPRLPRPICAGKVQNGRASQDQNCGHFRRNSTTVSK